LSTSDYCGQQYPSFTSSVGRISLRRPTISA
jgi:hypothetical protein